MTRNLKSPSRVVTAFFWMPSLCFGIWWYARVKSSVEKIVLPCRPWNESWQWAVGYRSGIVFAFSAQKSPHNRQLPVDLDCICIGLVHKLLDGRIMLSSKRYSISWRRASSFGPTRRQGRWATGGPVVSIWWAIGQFVLVRSRYASIIYGFDLQWLVRSRCAPSAFTKVKQYCSQSVLGWVTA